MSDLPTLLPPNAQAIELDLEQLSARLQGLADPVQGLWDASICPAHLLPYLAWAFSIEVWEASWSEAHRRQVLVDAVAVHRRKGTIGSVRRALGNIGFRTEISEWFQHGGDPHTFRVDAYGADVFAAGYQIDPALLQMLALVLVNIKPERSHFDLRVGETFDVTATAKPGCRQSARNRATLSPQPRTHELDAAPYLAPGIRQRGRMRAEFVVIPREGALYAI